MKLDLLCIYGPTCSGKSDLAIELALSFAKNSFSLGNYERMEIINCDAMQCYQGLPICTNKPTSNEVDLIPHHLFGFLDPIRDLHFTVHDFRIKVRQCIQQLHEKNSLPILCGGTSYYMQAVLEEEFLQEEIKSTSPFEKEDFEFTSQEVQEMYEKLKQVNPSVANKLHPNNIRKIRNALQMSTSSSTQQHSSPKLYYKNCIFIYLDVKEENKHILKERINFRCEEMLKKGLLQELQSFYLQYKDNYWNCNHGIFQSIGIKQFNSYFKNTATIEECLESFKGATRKYARKQRMWFTNYWTHSTKSCIMANHVPCFFFELLDKSQISKVIVPTLLDILLERSTSSTILQYQVPCTKEEEEEIEWKKYHCTICNKECNGSKEWNEHLQSKQHKCKKKKSNKQTIPTLLL